MLHTALDQKADPAAIEQALFQAARSNPRNAQAHTDLGLFYTSKMQLEKAMDCFGQALQLDPNLRDAVWGRGYTCRLNGHGQSAIDLCKEFLKKNPNDTEIKQVLEAILSENPQASLAPDPEFNSRQSIINYLIDRFGYKKYLEIGCKLDATFSNINIPYKIGVDPIQGGTLRMTSDRFFELTNDTFDLIFIDGLHLADQVVRDIHNAQSRLNNNGTIVLHDCNPAEEPHQFRNSMVLTWNGDVWKAIVHYRQDPHLDTIVGDFDQGIGIIRKRLNPDPIRLPAPYLQLRWSQLQQNRQQWLRLSTPQQIAKWL